MARFLFHLFFCCTQTLLPSIGREVLPAARMVGGRKRKGRVVCTDKTVRAVIVDYALSLSPLREPSCHSIDFVDLAAARSLLLRNRRLGRSDQIVL
jgi:hypothetical protein